MKFFKSLLIKSVLIVLSIAFVLYPNPWLGIVQMQHFTNFESMIDPEISGMDEINKTIDSMLPEGYTNEVEFKTVEKFVYKNIPYEYDWNTWMNIDYWPTAQEVWDAKKEDCDGRAVLAASILRARGYKNACLTGNFQHIWVEVDGFEIMDPMKEKSFTATKTDDETSTTSITIPSYSENLRLLAMHIQIFPVFRNLLLILFPLLIIMFPLKNKNQFFIIMILFLTGFNFLQFWSRLYNPIVNSDFIVGSGLIGIAFLFALFKKSQTITKKENIRI